MGININDLTSAIMYELETYTRDVVEGMNQAGDKIAKQGAKKLRETSPKKSGKYAKGWAVKKFPKYNKPTEFVLYNKDKPGLAHLTEFGHAMKNGGRTQANPHIKPVEEEVVEAYTRAVEGVISGD